MTPLTTRRHRQEPDRHPTAPINPARGSRHGRAKLTEADVRDIRARWRLGCPVNGFCALAREYGVSSPTIQAIANWETWKHVTDLQEAA